ncbi:MAG: beta-lactamase family protein, partial [Chloroflexi bacterium]|nr:beta-lactamase family protein [Chloroflexota bacterium]
MDDTRKSLKTLFGGRRWSLRFYISAGVFLLAFATFLAAVVGFRSDLTSVVEIYQEEGLSGIYQAVNRRMERYGLRQVDANVEWESANPESQGIDSVKLDILRDDLVKRETDSFLVIRHDKVVYEWYAPDRGPGKRRSVASLSKAITGSIALLVALDDGRMKLDDPASSYIPAWRDDPAKSRITIRELATHSSGIENVTLRDVVGTGWKEIYYLNRNERFSLALTTAPVTFEPGTQYSYSGTGYYALAYAITSSLQGTPQSDVLTLLRERIMEP